MDEGEDHTGPPDGSQSVHEHAPESPGPGRTASQYLVIGLAALMIIAALLWVLLPLV